jgi:hypothetical protein
MSYDRQYQMKQLGFLQKKLNDRFGDVMDSAKDAYFVAYTDVYSPGEGGVSITVDGTLTIEDLKFLLSHLEEFEKEFPKK